MKILGIKLTHDAAFALVDNGKLIFSYELEKLNNNVRHIDFNIDLRDIGPVLRQYGYEMEELDKIVIDGWSADGWQLDGTNAYVDLPFFRKLSVNGTDRLVRLTHYGYLLKGKEALRPEILKLEDADMEYSSYPHISGHIFSSYCTSPFAISGEPSYVLVWDGSIVPQLFYFDKGEITTKGILFPLVGQSLVFFSRQFPPYDNCGLLDISIAGKIMAYIALGSPREDLLTAWQDELTRLMESHEGKDPDVALTFSMSRNFVEKAVAIAKTGSYSGADILCSFHYFLQIAMMQGLQKLMSLEAQGSKNLCIAGGCALNIKWNSSIRDSGMFHRVWVPPFPNDAGSALGAACCEMVNQGKYCLEWNVYSGPAIHKNNMEGDWQSLHCTLRQLAILLHNSQEPVVFLHGKAELGPRALGNRSILASAANPGMKDRLNKIKNREGYRPVAPICLEEYGTEVFSPGYPDPYMLFEHTVRDEWKDKTPAICHLDHTARLQTVNAGENLPIYELLKEYYKVSGIPLLCNTSANFNGKGFFPDLTSVAQWGGVLFVWCEGKLYYSRKTNLEIVKEWMTFEYMSKML